MTTSSQASTALAYTIDPSHTLVELSAKYMMFTTVKGRFTGVTGSLVHDADDLSGSSSVDVEIDPATLTTSDAKRDEHLRSADFLDVANFPIITFKSRLIVGSGEHYQVIGDLTIHGTTHEVTLDTTFNGAGKNPWGHDLVSFSAQTEINRKDFGLNWNVALEAGGVLVGDRVKISLEVQATRAA
jgi:polyisoprenoid-binding protein YceI